MKKKGKKDDKGGKGKKDDKGGKKGK